MFADGFAGVASTELMFRLPGGAQPLMLLPVRLNGEGPFEFILDTGAGISLLTPELAQRLDIKATGSKEGHTAGGKVSVSLAKVSSLALGDTELNDLEVGIVDLSHIGHTVGAKIDGDLGYNFLKHFRLTIDYHNLELRLDDPKRFDCVGASPLTEIPIRLAAPAKPLILVDTYLEGRGPFQFAIDTGTSTSAISPELARELGVKSAPLGPATTGGAQVELSGGKIQALQIGGAKIDNVGVVIGPFLAALSQAAGAKLDGIIGYNFLRHYRVVVDYPNQMLSLFSA
jgi:predicted aspartyl protease